MKLFIDDNEYLGMKNDKTPRLECQVYDFSDLENNENTKELCIVERNAMKSKIIFRLNLSKEEILNLAMQLLHHYQGMK